MKMTDCPFTVVDWNRLEPEEHKGDPGTAYWRTKQCGPLRVRTVEYSPGYVADHWCKKGHASWRRHWPTAPRLYSIRGTAI
jgi:hypothetical protein